MKVIYRPVGAENKKCFKGTNNSWIAGLWGWRQSHSSKHG